MTNDWNRTLEGEPPIVVTGAAGFIGYHLSARLLDMGLQVIGLDNMVPYYDIKLKQARLDELKRRSEFHFKPIDIANRSELNSLFNEIRPRRIVHLAAQAGVRYSIENPYAYGDSNLTGFLNILEISRMLDVAHLVYASSSSVYGGNRRMPFRTSDTVDHPVSLYAATKKANELMAHAYCHLYGFPATGLRFFTVYGPWGRPDMAYWKFAEAIGAGRPIEVFNHGDMGRDFTYIDDIIESLVRLIAQPPHGDPDFDFEHPDPASSWAPHRVYNIGATRPERLMDMIAILEEALGRKAEVQFAPMQPGDVKETWADVDDLERAVGFRPQIDLRTGLQRFVTWQDQWLHGERAP